MVKLICVIPLCGSMVQDKVVWAWNRSGRYSVTFGY